MKCTHSAEQRNAQSHSCTIDYAKKSHSKQAQDPTAERPGHGNGAAHGLVRRLDIRQAWNSRARKALEPPRDEHGGRRTWHGLGRNHDAIVGHGFGVRADACVNHRSNFGGAERKQPQTKSRIPARDWSSHCETEPNMGWLCE